jgi:hypothetical protein
MKLFEIPMVIVFVVSLCLLSSRDVPSARADFVFGAPVNLKSVIPAIDRLHDCVDCLSYDGLEVYIESDRSDGYGGWDLWVLRRDALDADWGPPENLGPVVNSSGGELRATISADGLTLFFGSTRPGGQGNADLYMTTRATREASWGPPVNLGPNINSSAVDAHPWISADGLELYFQSNRPGGYGDRDLWVTTRPTVDKDWGQPTNLGSTLNTSAREAWPCTTPDGLALFFFSDRPSSHQGADLYMAKRATRKDPWGVPVDLCPEHNGPPVPQVPCISPDGHSLYFFYAASMEDFDNYQVPILPIVDFNADGKIDLVDLVMLIDNWGTSKTLCDIGPMPWGDGKVDIEDLKVFMTYYEKENPPKQ